MVAELPSGLVTFLLTDIEGSTRLFRRLGDRWPVLLERHHQLLRSAWAAHDGAEFKSEGDGVLVAFRSASEAMAAAVDAQRGLRAEAWPADAPIRVRMGLHTGIAYPRDGDYIALALHQAARVVGAANVGQVLASLEAVSATERGTNGFTTTRLGAYRLRDFERPAELFQVSASGEADESFASPRAVPADGHNIERPRDSFIGRFDELAALTELVGAGRLVTVCGPGGMGKTRIAIEFALRSARAWDDGVWMVELAAIRAGQPIASAVAATVGVDTGEEDALDAVEAHLRGKRALVILDNCEHVLEGARALARRVLSDCPSIGLLATSRERLGVGGEHIHVLSPLPLTQDCVELFAVRASQRDSSMLFGGEDREIMLEICRRLDGLPLAIELAAARAHVLAPREILDGLRGRLADLGRRGDGVVERQRTLRRLLDWSYDLLDTDEQAVFRRLAAFAGSFNLSGAAAACGGDGIEPEEVADVVWSLVDKSLVNVERREGSTRYRLLETVRSVASLYSATAGDAGSTRTRLGEYYLREFPWDRRGNREWRARLALEEATMLRMVDQLLADGHVELAHALTRLAVEGALGSSSSREAVRVLTQIIDDGRASPGLARLHGALAKLLAERGELDAAASHLARARRLVAELGDHDRLGQVQVAGVQLQLSLRVATEAALRQAQQELRAELVQSSSPEMRAHNLIGLAITSSVLGESTTSDELREALGIADELDDHGLRMTILCNLAEDELRRGETAAAARHQQEAMRLSGELDYPLVTAIALALAARIAQPAGLDATAVRLHAAADALLAECEFELTPDDRMVSDEMLEGARLNLGALFEDESAAGRGLALAEALAAAEDVFAQAMRDAEEPREPAAT